MLKTRVPSANRGKRPQVFESKNLLLREFSMGPGPATCWGMLAALAPSILVLGMSATSDVPIKALIRFAMLSFATAGFGVCFLLTRQCFGCVRSVGYTQRRVLKSAALEPEGPRKSHFLQLADFLEQTLAVEVSRFIHFACWTGLSLGLFLWVATDFVRATAATSPNPTQALLASANLATTGTPDALSINRKTVLSVKEWILFSLSSLSVVMATIKVYRSHRFALMRQNVIGRIPVDFLCFSNRKW